MAIFSLPRMPFSESVWDRLLSSLDSAINKWDYDSGWVVIGSKVFNHNLNVLPRQVLVYASNSADGSAYSTDTASAVTTSAITITGPKAYCRVLANK